MYPILASLSLAAAAAAGVPSGPCALVSRDEVARIQKAPVVSEKESVSGGKSVESRSCYFQAEPFSKSVSLEWSRDREPGAARRQWSSLFHEKHEESDREKDEKEEKRAAPTPVGGVGDEAYWVPSHASGAIYAFGSGSFVRVSVGGEGTDEEKRGRASAIAREALASLAATGGK
jgi:hypothetical protein